MMKSSCLRNSFNRKFRRKLLPSMNFALILQESQSNRFRVSIKDVPDLSKDFQYHCSRLCPFSLLAENLFLTMSKLSTSVRKCCHGNLCQAHGNLKWSTRSSFSATFKWYGNCCKLPWTLEGAIDETWKHFSVFEFHFFWILSTFFTNSFFYDDFSVLKFRCIFKKRVRKNSIKFEGSCFYALFGLRTPTRASWNRSKWWRSYSVKGRHNCVQEV